MSRNKNYKVPQSKVNQLHANVRQMQVDMVYLRANQGTLTAEATEAMLDDLLADLSHLKDKLPPIQLKLPL